MRTKDGKSRQFAFVGFRSDQQAEDARKFFHNTYIGLSRIAVEVARKMDVKDSKEAKDTMGKLKGKDKLKLLQAELSEASKPTKSTPKNTPKEVAAVQSKKKADFMDVSKGAPEPWMHSGNDMNIKPAARAAVNSEDEDAQEESDGSDAEEDEDSSDSDDDQDDEEAKPLSDMDYLRSKMRSKHTADASDSSDSDSDSEAVEASPAPRTAKATSTEKADHPVDMVLPLLPTIDEQLSDDIDESRLFIRNLPFGCSEEELTALLQPYNVSEVHIPLVDHKPKGYGFAQFIFPEDADRALAELDRASFQGRVLHVNKALRGHTSTFSADSIVPDGSYAGKLSAFKLKKEEERKKAAARKDGWNAAFVRSDTVVDALASKYGVENADILDTNLKGGDLAVRMAIGETQVIQENQSYLTSMGVDLNALESLNSTSKSIKRSTTTLLIKNLPPQSEVQELENMFVKFGSLANLIFPPSKTLLLVDFIEPTSARAALKGLAYRRYKNSPLYIEYAPVGIITAREGAQPHTSTAKPAPTPAAAPAAPVDDVSEYSTIFIKNLNFTTTEEVLAAHISGLCAGVRMVIIQKKQKGSQMLSMGYGFVEFTSAQYASIALDKLQKSALEGHMLEVKPSDKRLSANQTAIVAVSNKLLVKNVAFQASKQEMKTLFDAFGSVKTLRMPKQLKSTQHRGFAFVEFHTKQEASRAMAALRNTHLYGRHLVIDWAKDEDMDNLQLSLEDGGQGSAQVAQELEQMNTMRNVDKLRKRARKEESTLVRKKQKGGAADDLVDAELQDIV